MKNTIDLMSFAGYIGEKIKNCKLKNKQSNWIIDDEYRNSFYNQYGNKKIVDCKIFMQGEPGAFFILNDGDIISTKMFI